MKRKILLCALSFIAIALFSCGIAFLPNWNPSPTTPPSDIGQEEGVFETEAATQPTNTSGTWTDSGIRGTSFGGGSGTASDPYIISNAQQLAYLAYMVNAGNSYSGKYFEQTANIDLSAYYWVPIGRSFRPFSGNYTANPFGVITNLYIKSDYDYTGLFGYVRNATISNIGISGGYIEGGGDYTGGLVGYAYGTTTIITNCYNTGDVNSSSNSGYSYAGGLVGYVDDDLTITGSYNTGNVTSTTTSSYAVYYSSAGGLVGYVYYDLTITGSYNTGNVTSTTTSSTSYAGGFVGKAHGDITIANSYNTGSVTGEDYTGGLVGDVGGTNTITNITNCYNTGNVTSTSYYPYAGGLVGRANDGDLTITIENSYNTGNVTSTSPGTSYSSSNAGGLVGGVSNPATIINSYNTGDVTSTTTSSSPSSSYSSYAGGLVGRFNNGSLSYCHNIGDISAYPSAAYVGAIVGVVISSTTFTKCYYYCEGARGGVNGKDVSGTSENANLLGSDIIFRSQSDYTNTALWTEPFWDFDNTWKIVNNMNGNYPVLKELTEFTLTVNPNGGTWNGSSSSQNFTQNYNTIKSIRNPEKRYGYYFDGWILLGSGSLNGTTFTFGGGDCTLTANWIETWAVNYTVPSGSGTASSPYQVDSASDLAYFAYKTQILGEQCFDHIVLTKDIDLAGYDWMPIGTGRNVVSGVQPYFRGTFDGQGHTISNLNINVEGYQELNEYGLFGLIDVDAVLKNFTILSGEVNGSAKVGGAVGWLWSASVENVINYANINGSSYVGGIVGNYHSWEGNFVRECQNYGTITGTNYTAGIVGGGDDSSGMQNIVDCVNYGTIKGASFTGGIVGNIVKVKMSGCVNYGSISGQDRVGGIAGRVNNNSVVSELVNYGDVTGWTHVAGILGGAAYADSATSCFNLGNIKGESHIGGVIGYVYDGITLTNSANFGNITGTNTEVGGLIGLVESSSAGAVIRNNGSEGAVVGTGATNVGGLIGRAGGTNVIENNYLNMSSTTQSIIGAGTISGTYIYILDVNGTTYKRYHGDVSNFVWVNGSDCPIPKEFSWAGEHLAQVTTTNLTSAGFTSI